MHECDMQCHRTPSTVTGWLSRSAGSWLNGIWATGGLEQMALNPGSGDSGHSTNASSEPVCPGAPRSRKRVLFEGSSAMSGLAGAQSQRSPAMALAIAAAEGSFLARSRAATVESQSIFLQWAKFSPQNLVTCPQTCGCE